MAIICPYYLCPKSIKTRLRASVSSKNFTRTPVSKGRGGKAKERVGLEGMEGREWEGKTDEGKERREQWRREAGAKGAAASGGIC
jgi:hypothetical protein